MVHAEAEQAADRQHAVHICQQSHSNDTLSCQRHAAMSMLLMGRSPSKWPAHTRQAAYRAQICTL
jgi:hypothetical protein